MRIIILVIVLCQYSSYIFSQIGRVGINTTSPAALLHVKDSSVVFTGNNSLPINPGPPPISGAGTRMMWYPDKAAFRVGTVDGPQWNRDSIGNYSFAIGNKIIAKGLSSFVIGENSKANGNFSTSIGSYNEALGMYSITMGDDCSAYKTRSIAIGFNSISNGYAAIAIGEDCSAFGSNSFSIGKQNTATGINATAIGSYSLASGYSSVSIGESNNASGDVAISIGKSNFATGINAIALGSYTIASGYRSTSLGEITTASGNISTAMGQSSNAIGDIATTMGLGSISKAFLSLTIGRYNNPITTSSETNWIDTDPLFIIGNGTSHNNRKNAITILKNAKTGINTATPDALLHLKAAESTFNMHIKLEAPNSEDYAAIVYDGSFKMKTFGGNDTYSWRDSIGNTRMLLTSTGNLDIDGNLTQGSDARMKKDILPLQNSLTKISQLNGYHYHWEDKYRDQTLQTGILAQEVEVDFPELVITDEEEMKKVNYIGLIPHLIEAIKELKKENELLRAEIQKLK